MSRESILSAIRGNQPEFVSLPALEAFSTSKAADTELYIKTLQGIGGRAIRVASNASLPAVVAETFADLKRVISTMPEVYAGTEADWELEDPHDLETVDLAIIQAKFAVAENGAVWVTENEMIIRVLPFICEHLAVVVSEDSLVPTMHEAYERIGKENFGFGVFIAGPSKTADIEQSLVLGAHGPKTMTIFLLGKS